MSKLKSILRTVLCLLTVIIVLGVVSVILRPHGSVTPTEPSENFDYAISYRMVISGEEEIYEPLFKDDGEYPVGYNDGDTITVSDLNGKVKKTPLPDSWGTGGAYGVSGEYSDPNNFNRTFAFYGWFLDSDCTVGVSDNTLRDMSGDITLYAKVVISQWTKFY